MGNSKSKKRRDSNSNSKNVQSVNIIIPENITNDEMQHIIANAILEAEDIKERRKQIQKGKERDEWREKIGVKSYNGKFKNILNGIKVLFKISFMPKKCINGNKASIALMKFILSLFLDIVSVILLLLSLYLTIIIHFQHLFTTIPELTIFYHVISVMYGILIFAFSRIFRMASIEVEKNENQGYLFSLFASVTSVISIIIAVIALVKGG